MYVPAKSVVTYQMKVAIGFFQPTAVFTSADDLEAAIANDINSTNGFTVTDWSVQSSSMFSSNPDQITMKIRTGNIDFSSEFDVQSIIDHAVYQEMGALPASVITDITPPSAPGGTTSVFNHTGTVPTGQSQTTPGSSSSSSGGGSTWLDQFTSFLSGASTGGILGIGLAIIGMVLLFGFLAQKKLLRV